LDAYGILSVNYELVDDPPSRLEPTIKDFFNPLQITLALFGRNGDVVNRLSVEVLDASDTGKLLELSNRADADNLT
jgi:hypothetical protein